MKRLYIFSALYSFFISSILLANFVIYKIISYESVDPKEVETWWLHHILWINILLFPICVLLFIFAGLKIQFPKPYYCFFIINLLIIVIILLANNDFIIWFLD